MTQKTIHTEEKNVAAHNNGNGKDQNLKLKASIHRRILNFINQAVRPEDLVYEKMHLGHGEGDHFHEDNPELLNAKPHKILDFEIAKAIMEFKDREFPFGFRNLKEVLEL